MGVTAIWAERVVERSSLIIPGTILSFFLIFGSITISPKVAKNDSRKPTSVKYEGFINSITAADRNRARIAKFNLPISCAKKAIDPIIAALTIGASKPDKTA